MPPQDSAPSHETPALPQKAPDVESAQERFQMKPLGEVYRKGEKENAAQTVQMGGRNIEVHEKDWLRAMSDADRKSKGQQPLTDAQWREHVATTQYMQDADRQEHQLHFRPGFDATGVENVRVSGESLKKGGEHIFVMDGEGKVFAKEGQDALNQKDDTGRKVHVHHSSFLAGEDVAGAGEMKINEQGFISAITDRSGHYKPGEEQTVQTLNELENQGVSLDNVKFTLDRGEQKIAGMAGELQQGGEETFKARHTMADEIKQNGRSVRDILNHDAERRATRVRKAGEHLQAGQEYAAVSKAALAHAAKDAAALHEKMPEGSTVRADVAASLGQKPGASSNTNSHGMV